jgi:hypothetical protein
MNEAKAVSDRDDVLHALRELITALDRRVPHVERLGEARIASEAASLRMEAVRRIEELTAEASDNDALTAAAVMADDAGPLD